MAPIRPFVVDPALSAIAVAYRNDSTMLIADQALPRTPVPQERFKWIEYPLAESFTVPETQVGRRGRVNQVELTGEDRIDEVNDYGLDASIVQSDIDAAADARNLGTGNYDPEGHAAMWLTDLIMLARELRAAKLLQDPATYASTRRITLAGTDQFSDYSNSNPIDVIRAGIAGTLIRKPNTICMGEDVWTVLQTHPHLVNACLGGLTNKGIITPEAFGQLFGLKNVLIGQAWVNTAKPGQPVTMSHAWGKHISLMFIDPTARADMGITFGMTAQYGARIAGRIEEPDIGLQGGHRIRVGERVKELVIAKDLGYFIQNAVA